MNESMETYPNHIHGHLLKRYKKTGNGLCSCNRWELMGASEGSLIRSHILHIENLPDDRRPACAA